MTISRRKFLGWLGAAGLGATVGQKAARAASNKHFDGYPESNGVLFDNTRCTQAGSAQPSEKLST